MRARMPRGIGDQRLEREGVRELRQDREPRHRKRGDKRDGPDGRERGGQSRPRSSPVEPHRQPDERNRGQGQQVALGQQTDVPRREDADLDHEPRAEGQRRRDIGGQSAALTTEADEERHRAERHDAGHEHEVAGVVERITERLACGVARLSRRRVRAEERAQVAVGGEPPGRPRARQRDEPGGCGPEPERLPWATVEDGLERHGGHEHGQEHERLEPRHRRERGCSDQPALAPERRSLERARERPRREDERRIERHLRHDEPRIGEPGNRDGQR